MQTGAIQGRFEKGAVRVDFGYILSILGRLVPAFSSGLLMWQIEIIPKTSNYVIYVYHVL